jgi:hypothetical protein
VPLLAYCAYMQVHAGDALAIFHAERLPSFGHALATPLDGFRSTWQTMTSASNGEVRSVFAREIALGLLGLVACAGMFPAVLLAADVTARFRHVRAGLLVASGVLMCAATWVYAQGRWLG